jgi:hypothetical protein
VRYFRRFHSVFRSHRLAAASSCCIHSPSRSRYGSSYCRSHATSQARSHGRSLSLSCTIPLCFSLTRAEAAHCANRAVDPVCCAARQTRQRAQRSRSSRSCRIRKALSVFLLRISYMNCALLCRLSFVFFLHALQAAPATTPAPAPSSAVAPTPMSAEAYAMMAARSPAINPAARAGQGTC